MGIDLGPPPETTHEMVLYYLSECLKEGAYEDAAGHLCNLLEFCRLRTFTEGGWMPASLEAMIQHYGKQPKPPRR